MIWRIVRIIPSNIGYILLEKARFTTGQSCFLFYFLLLTCNNQRKSGFFLNKIRRVRIVQCVL